MIIVANNSVGSNSISAKDAGDIFLGRKKKLDDGSKAKLASLKEGDTHKAFLEQFVKRSNSQFRSHWKKAVFTGQGKPPKSFATEDELVAYVASTPGAIGYVDSATDTSSVKVLSIN